MNLISVICLGAVGVAGFYVMPLIVGAVAEAFSLGPGQQGQLASCELAGMSVSSLGAVFWMRRVRRRVQVGIGMAALLAGNLMSMAAEDLSMLLVVRFLTGLGGGSVLAAAMAALAALPNADRGYGFLIAAEYGLSAAGFLVLPNVVMRYGVEGLFGVLALLAACSVPLIRWLPEGPGDADLIAGTRQVRPSGAIANLAAIAFYSIGFSGVWAYVERIGSWSGFAPQAIGNALAVGSIMSVLGALSVAVLAGRIGRTRLLTLAAAVQVLALLSFIGEFGLLRYAVAVAALSFFWNVTFPTLFSIMADLDRSGRWVVVGNVAAFAGTAAGPVCVGALLSNGSVAVVNVFGASLMVLCWSATLIGGLVTHRHAEQEVADALRGTEPAQRSEA